jgi:serine/threonine protein kinase
MQENIKIIFENKEEILNTISHGDEITELLGLPSEKCALIGTEIKLGKSLGKGSFGEVFSITFPGMGKKQYVVKKGALVLEVIFKPKSRIMEILKVGDFALDYVMKWQTPERRRLFNEAKNDNNVSILIPPKICRLSQDRLFTEIPNRNARNGNKDHLIKIEKGSYLCSDASFSEFVIGSYTGKLYRDGLCINFFNVYSMFTCVDYESNFSAIYNQYIFMDKIDNSMRKISKCITLENYAKTNFKTFVTDEICNGVFIQVMFAIAMYQNKYNISHNNLHDDNVFVEYVTKDTTFNSEKLIDKEWYHYRCDNIDIYFPAIPVIVKIGDFGLSVKYSKPIVGNKAIFSSGHVDDGTGHWIPNIYLPSYDSLFFMVSIWLLLGRQTSWVKENKYGKLIPECVRVMCPTVPKSNNPDFDYFPAMVSQGYVRRSNGRPVLNNLTNVLPAISILKGPIANMYGKKPKTGTIITLGIL